MKKWIVRFGSLYVFNLVVLLVIGLLRSVDVGWGALWAAVVLTLASLWVKPVITKAFANRAAKSPGQRGKTRETLARWGTVFVTELIVWVIVVLLSGVHVNNWFWGYLLPPVILLIGWAIYAAIDDKIETRADALYDQAHAGISGASKKDASTGSAASSVESAQTQAARAELHDGLTDEQRRMFDDLS